MANLTSKTKDILFMTACWTVVAFFWITGIVFFFIGGVAPLGAAFCLIGLFMSSKLAGAHGEYAAQQKAEAHKLAQSSK